MTENEEREARAARERQAYAQAKSDARRLVAEAEAVVEATLRTLSDARVALGAAQAALDAVLATRRFKSAPAVGTRVRAPTWPDEPAGVVVPWSQPWTDKNRVAVRWDVTPAGTSEIGVPYWNTLEPYWNTLEPEEV